MAWAIAPALSACQVNPYPHTMKGTRIHIALLWAGAAATWPSLAWSQTTPTPNSAKDEEVTTLATFTITETRANPYQSGQALSASRVAMPSSSR